MLRLGILFASIEEVSGKGLDNTFPFLSILVDSTLMSNEKQECRIRVEL